MTIDDKIKYGKLQYNINREAAKISALSFGKIDKYEYLTVEQILPSNRRQIKYQVCLFSFRKKLLKNKQKRQKNKDKMQTKTIEEQGLKQVETLEVLLPHEDKEQTK